MKKKCVLLLIKRLVGKIAKILHLGSIDSLDRLHVYMRYGNFVCHITLVDCFNAENFPECGLFIQLYEKMSDSKMRLLHFWQLPNSVSSVKWENLRHIGLSAILKATRNIFAVVKFGTFISEENFVQT